MIELAPDLPPIVIGVTQTVYSVAGWTNISGASLPSVFRVRYRLGANRYRVYEGVAKSIRATCRVTDFFPDIPEDLPVLVVDDRLASRATPGTRVSYLSTEPDGIVRDLGELKKTDAYAEAQLNAKAAASQPPDATVRSPGRLRPVLYGLFLISALLGIWILLKAIRKKE